MLKAYSLDVRIASIGSQLIDRVHQVGKNLENLPVYKNPHIGTKISMIDINDIYRDSIMIFSSENMIFLIFSKYKPLLLLFTYFSNSCISNRNCPSP